MLYPWQEKDYEQVCNSFSLGAFSSLLIYGAKQSGAAEFIHYFINFMLCQNPDNGTPCGVCTSCTLFLNDNHPDLITLQNENEEDKSKAIKVDQIRKLIDYAALSSHISKYKIIYLPDALLLNLNSANALLKILEEPPANCIFILYAESINRLLPTLLSRCFKYQLSIPAANDLLGVNLTGHGNSKFWLTYFNGEPFYDEPFNPEQLNLLISVLLKPSISNIFELSRQLDPKKIGMAVLLDFVFRWLSDLLIVKYGVMAKYFADYQESLQKLAVRLNLEKTFLLQDELIFLREWSEHPLNHKLQWENILLKYQQLFA